MTGNLDAATEAEAEDTLRDRGLFPTIIRAARIAAPRVAAPPKLNRRELALFTMHLATVMKSGLPLALGLRHSIEEGSNKRLQTVAHAILQRVEQGQMISEAMADLPTAFPPYYVNLVKAGETVGQVDQVLFDLLASIEWQMNLRGEIRQATIYPAILLTMMGIVTLGIATFVMPRFVAALSKTGMTLPTSARLVVGFGDFVTGHWLQVLLGLVWLVIGARMLVKTPRGSYMVDSLKLQMPLVGNLIRQVGLSRFAHHLRMMVRAGVNFVVALNVVEHVVGNQVLAEAVARARDRVIAGASLADALRETRQFTPLVVQMVATGEVTGTLDETLKKVSDYYDREVPAAVKRITTAMEPIMYVILGVLVLGVAFTLYSPLLSMLSQIQTRPRF
ncbi:MAG: type II secretion system F family protein [Acidobacteria bacterium]|nr:type II secretion system F family protein [Acidobacteriota bacterium]